MSKKTALYAGSFDPFTLGHEDIIQRSLELFDEVTIVIAQSPSKKALLSFEQRKEMLNLIFKNNSRVKVDSWGGLLVDYAKEKKINARRVKSKIVFIIIFLVKPNVIFKT